MAKHGNGRFPKWSKWSWESHFNSKWQMRPMRVIVHLHKWPKIGKMANTLTKNGKKWVPSISIWLTHFGNKMSIYYENKYNSSCTFWNHSIFFWSFVQFFWEVGGGGGLGWVSKMSFLGTYHIYVITATQTT